MQRARVYIPTEDLAGGDIVQVFHAGPGQSIDWSQPMRGGQIMAVRGRDAEHWAAGRSERGPAGMSPAGAETVPAVVLSVPLGPGVHTFGLKTLDRQTLEAAGDTPETKQILVDTAPRAARNLIPVEDWVSGKLRFTFNKSEDF